jgi:hypothetical protein
LAAGDARHAAEQRRAEPFAQGGDVVLGAGHVGVDPVGDPAGQRQATGGDGLGGEQGVVDAAEPEADDQDDRQAEGDGEIGAVAVDPQWHAKSADAFDDDDAGLLPGAGAGGGDAGEVDADASLGGGQVGSDGRGEAIGVDDIFRQSLTLLAARMRSTSSLLPAASVPAATGLIPAAVRPSWRARWSRAQVMKVLPISVSVPVRK